MSRLIETESIGVSPSNLNKALSATSNNENDRGKREIKNSSRSGRHCGSVVLLRLQLGYETVTQNEKLPSWSLERIKDKISRGNG